MQVRVLGPLELVRDGAVVAVPSPQQRRLLTALLLAPGRVVSTDQLMAALWGEAPPRSAPKSLQAHVSRLRTALGDGGDAIVTHDGGYSLRVDAGQIDAVRFERLVHESRAAASADPASARSLVDAALALWRGPAHADFAGEAFVRADVVRLEELRINAMEERFDLLLADGRPGEIVGDIEAFARQHPLRERPHAQLMLALYRDGRQAHALDAFLRFRTTLADELGLEPSAALISLQRDILRRDPRLDPDAAGSWRHRRLPMTSTRAVAGGSRPGDAFPLAERDAQLDALEHLLADVAEHGVGRLAIVHGEAGSGKTALLRAFCDNQPDDRRVLWGACEALFTPRPLGPVRDVARQVGGVLHDAVRAGAQPYDVAAELAVDVRAHALSVLILEDLHWADEATLDVVRLLGRRVASLPALLVLSHRDEIPMTHPVREVLGELVADPAVGVLPLERLSPTAVTELAARQGRDGAQIHAVTGGNPLFVVELLASTSDEVPATIREMVLGRAGALDDAARAVLEAIAAVPPRIDVDILSGLVDHEVHHVDACIASGLIVTDATGLAFRHELARRAVAEATPVHRRRAVHRRALAALTSSPAHRQDLALLAHHADAAGDVDAVLRFADAAGREAARMGAHREAAAHYASVLRHADALAPAARADVLERRARSCYLTDQNAAAIDAMERAVRLYRQLGDQRRQGDALRQLSQFLWCPGRTREAMERARTAVEVLERLPVGPELGMAYSTIAQLAMNVEDIEATTTWSARAIAVADAIGDVAIDVHARTNLATVAALTGEASARERLDDCVATAAGAHLDEHVGRALLNQAVSAIRWHDHAGAAAALDRVEALCGELGHELLLFYVRAYQSAVALDTGDWRLAAQRADLVLRRPRTSTVPRIIALSVTALLAARTGTGASAPALELADDLAASTDELERMVPPVLARAEVAWLERRTDDIPAITRHCWQRALARRATWMIGPLAAWRRRAGLTDELPAGVAQPYALQAAGRHHDAARWWSERRCAYAAALSLLDAGDPSAVARASRMLNALGATSVGDARRPAVT